MFLGGGEERSVAGGRGVGCGLGDGGRGLGLDRLDCLSWLVAVGVSMDKGRKDRERRSGQRVIRRRGYLVCV